MVKVFRVTQHWDHWLSCSTGQHLLTAESKILSKLLSQYIGKHALLIGVPEQAPLLASLVTSHRFLLSPLMSKNKNLPLIESGLNELPIASGSIDLVLLPHLLEQLDNPRLLLTEACRVIKPEGYIVVVGFNPFSLWG